jgi:uncharacterized protein
MIASCRLKGKGLWAVLLLCAGLSLRAHGLTPSDQLLERLGTLRPQTGVVDLANVMDARSRAALESLLVELRRKTGVELRVLTLSSLEGGEIDDFTNRLFEKWRIGKDDRGLLLLAAIEDRKVRVEVGYGLEALITDAKAGRILDNEVLPHFKRGDYATGLYGGALGLASIIAADARVGLTGRMPVDPSRSRGVSWFHILLLIIAIPIIIRNPWLLLFILNSGGRGYSRGGFGGGFGGFGGGLSGGGGASRSW